jgi:solute carrier family 25 carnitine/acylcarnitine transporter 20/29
MSITNMAILTGLQFPLTGAVTKLFTGGENRRLTNAEQIASGFCGGALSGFACAPMELIMIQQQRFGTSLISTPMKIMGETGAAGLMRGLLMSCGREGLFTAGYLGIGPVINRTLMENHGLSEATAKAGGAIGGGVIAATLSHPLDTVKTCMQGDIQRTSYGTVTETFSTLYGEAGPSRFFRGWSWRTGRMICAVFIMNECKVRLAPILFPYHFRD